MATNKLVAYWIRLRQRGTDEQFWDLSDLRGHEKGIYYETLEDMFFDFCRGHSEFTYFDGKNQESFTISLFEREDNVIEGVLQKGDSGLNANHYNTEEDQRTFNARTTEIAEEIPFYFLFHRLENTASRSVLILREFGHNGTKRIITELFKEAIRATTNQGIYQEKKVFTYDAERAINQADKIASLRLIGQGQLSATDQIANDIGFDETNPPIVDKDLHLTAGGTILERIAKSLINGSPNIKYAGIDFEDYEKAKVTVDQNGSDLTFSLFNPEVK